MRLAGTFDDAKSARLIVAILREEKISCTFEKKIDPASHNERFYLWVYDEQEAGQAKAWIDLYRKEPNDPRFLRKLPFIEGDRENEAEKNHSSSSQSSRRKTSGSDRWTKYIIFLCAILFLISGFQSPKQIKQAKIAEELALTPLQTSLLFDYPSPFEEMEKILEDNQVKNKAEFERLPQQVQSKFDALEKQPYWEGFYELVLKWPQSKVILNTPLFHNILQGEIWRLISPALLHGNFLHILFNMLWLWLLGVQVERRIGALRYLFLSLIIGVTANIAQYLMSGPFFLGYSGIIAGLAGFIWMRQKIAPWEGYPLQKGTILFLAIFIVALAGLQIFSFIFKRLALYDLPLNFANTAHIVGAIAGIILGKMRVFSGGKV